MLPFDMTKSRRAPGFPTRIVMIAFVLRAVEGVSDIRDDLLVHRDQNRFGSSLSRTAGHCESLVRAKKRQLSRHRDGCRRTPCCRDKSDPDLRSHERGSSNLSPGPLHLIPVVQGRRQWQAEGLRDSRSTRAQPARLFSARPPSYLDRVRASGTCEWPARGVYNRSG